MAIVEELLRTEKDGALSFGNYKLAEKTKKDNFEYAGDFYKVKTYADITKLEKNGMLVYESVPGTGVVNFKETGEGVEFVAEGAEDVQLTIGLTEDTDYEIFIDGKSVGKMNTGLSGKLSISVELEAAGEVPVRIVRA